MVDTCCIVKDIANEFTERFVHKTEKLKMGDPLSEATDLGPIVNASGLKTIDSQVKDSVKEGAEILTGGEQIGSKGLFYKPTILKKVSTHMRVVQEEVFGPAGAVMVAEDEMEAVKLANDSQYGFGASIWTQDLDKAEKLSRMVRSGIVTVNNVVISDPRVPFGGVKIDLEIKDKSYRNSDLVLRISFTLKNESKTEIYTALSPSCRITNLSRLIIETFVPFSQEKWIGSSESKTGYNRYSITAKIVKFTTDVNLPYITIQIIQDNFEKSFRLGTIFFDIEIIFPILISNVNQVKELEDSKLMKYCMRHPTEGPAWRDWMTNWGFRKQLMRKYTN